MDTRRQLKARITHQPRADFAARDRLPAAPARQEQSVGNGAREVLTLAQVQLLQETAGNAAVNTLIVQRHPVGSTPVHRHTAADLFGAPGTTLEEFVQSLEVQGDWFAEPTLTAPDRTDLHALLRRTKGGPHILAGVGDVRLTEIRAVAAGDWPALEEYGRGRLNTGLTVRLIDAAPRPLADRIALGRTLLALAGIIPAPVLGVTVSEAQLLDVHAFGLVPAIGAYWATFHPHLEMGYEAGAGARGPEFQHVIELLHGPGIGPFAGLLGHIRNLHRFPIPLLVNLFINWLDHSRARPVHLIIHTGHDATGAFQGALAGVLEGLIADPRNLHLMIEGQGSIADITAAVPTIAADYGQPDGAGIPRLGQVMIAGHGEAQQVEGLAGTGAPVVADGHVSYPKDNLDIADPAKVVATTALLNTLLASMDPAHARLVYFGCLVASNPVPPGLPAAGIAAHMAATPSLGTFTEHLGAAHGIRPGFVEAARASVAPGMATSLMDAAGNMAIQFPFDPNAYGNALAYVATGHEPEGLFRAAVEVAVTAGPVMAELQLRLRLIAGIAPGAHAWFDQVTIALVRVALAGVAAGAGVAPETLNMLAHMAGPPFLVGNAEDGHGRTVGTLVTDVNTQPHAAALYAELNTMGLFIAPTDAATRNGKFIIEQAWLNLGGARAGPLIAWLDATPAATAGWIGPRLDTANIAAASPALFPGAAAPTIGRIRLALAWLRSDPANVDVRAFLTAQVVRPPTGPELSGAIRPQLDGMTEHEVLTTLGVVAEVAPPVGGGAALPAANVEVISGAPNQVRVEPMPYEATVLPAALRVRTLPGTHGTIFAVVHAGDVLEVAGFTHNWAAIDRNGRIGFVHRDWITAP